jgi:hypothetical protein
MNKHVVMSLVLCLGFMRTSFCEAEENPVWKSSKYGIMVTHGWGGPGVDLTKNPDLSVPKSIDEVADAFDVPKFVSDLKSFGVEYLVFAAWHANMNPIFPSAAMDKWRGKGHAARRDVLGELIKELKPTGIKFFLYVHPSDGHDMSKEDQELLGWNESTNVPPAKWAPGKFVKWNNFMNEVFDEMGSKYGKDVLGYWVDGGWNKVDRVRLQNTLRRHNATAEFFSGMDMGGWCRKFNLLCPPDPKKGIPAATPQNSDTWPCFGANVNLLQGGCWYSTGGWARTSPENMLRYTVLEAACNTAGGGVGWAADTYTDGTWEPMVREYLAMMGQLIKPIEESIKNTRPSTSYITPQGSRIATLPQGIVATMSVDGAYEYIHVLNAPTIAEEAYRQKYVSVLKLPPPADFKKFTKAVMLRSGREATLTQDAKGVQINVRQDAWDPLDTVIKLSVQPGFGLLSLGKALAMSGPETSAWPLKNAVDGNMNTGWSSEPVKEGEAPWLRMDLGDVVTMARLHLYPCVKGNTVGYNFPVDFEVSVSTDGNVFTPVLSVTDYKVKSVRSIKTDYVWDSDLNDYRKAKAGEETGDLSLSGSGQKSPVDYPQHFLFPEGTKGRYVKISGTKLKDESLMQFTEIEVFGSK